MIIITSKTNCCGCTACSQICPKHCIRMKEDAEGFKYPNVDESNCIHCGLCEKVCPYLNQYTSPTEKPTSFACKTKDDMLRERSSSGGLFTVLATTIIHEGGVVFGAKFDDAWNVVHGYSETEKGLGSFRGSKYVQSDLGDSFIKVKEFLKTNRKVLFTGTPCQVAGLNHFLGKFYDNLYTVDFVCHCVPSPKVWASYIAEVGKNNHISNVTFRDKSSGWNNYGIIIQSEKDILIKGSHRDNVYMKAFLSNLIVRPCCTNCPARHYKSGADITIADCWGFNVFHPDINDNKGMSLALLHTKKGETLYFEVLPRLDSMKIPYKEVQEESNHLPIIQSPKYHHYRKQFFKAFINGKETTTVLLERYINKGKRRNYRISSAKNMIRRLFGQRLIDKLRGH